MNESYGIATIESNYVVYSNSTSSSTNTFSNVICDIYNDEYFTSGTWFTFTNTIKITYLEALSESSNEIQYITAESESVTLKANAVPDGGTCTGVLSSDKSSINMTCTNWTDPDYNTSDSLSYNFIYDDLLFLKSKYDSTPSISAVIGIGNITITSILVTG